MYDDPACVLYLCLIVIEPVDSSSNDDASSESDKEPGCNESRGRLKSQYVHPKGKDKGGMHMYLCILWLVGSFGIFLESTV